MTKLMCVILNRHHRDYPGRYIDLFVTYFNSNREPTLVPTLFRCFQSYAELKSAVTNYNDKSVQQKYGYDIGSWCVLKITKMSSLFSYVPSFNDIISTLDVSHVTDMSSIFSRLSSFNQDLSLWGALFRKALPTAMHVPAK